MRSFGKAFVEKLFENFAVSSRIISLVTRKEKFFAQLLFFA